MEKSLIGHWPHNMINSKLNLSYIQRFCFKHAQGPMTYMRFYLPTDVISTRVLVSSPPIGRSTKRDNSKINNSLIQRNQIEIDMVSCYLTVWRLLMISFVPKLGHKNTDIIRIRNSGEVKQFSFDIKN